MKNLILALSALSLLSSLSAETLESADGRKIEVDLVRKSDSEVWFKLKGKAKVMSYKIESLSDNSQQFIKDWAPTLTTKFEIDFSSGKRNRKDKAEDYDDRVYSMQPKLKVENRDQNSSSAAVTAHMYFFGRPILHSKGICLIYKLQFPIPSLEPLQDFTTQSEKEVTFGYDADDNGEVFGARYKGYLLVMTNEDGEEVFRKAVPEKAYGAAHETIKNMTAGYLYDSNFERAGDVRIRLR